MATTQPAGESGAPTIAFIGTGNMNEAVLVGALAGGCSASDFVATSRRESRCAQLRESHGVTTTTSNPEAVAGAQTVVLGVKPYQLDDVLAEIGPHLATGAVVVSLAVGRSTASLEERLPEGTAVVRVMPNTPAMVGRGMHAVTPGRHCDDEQLARTRALLAASGDVVTVAEKDHDAVTAVSGSGPAYLFYVADAMVEAGVLLGLQRDVAHRLAVQTIVGAGAMLAETGDTPVQLREKVSSPGGTTITALAELDARAVRAAVVAAMQACHDKSASLG